MTGLVTELQYAGRSRDGSRLASEQMALLESIGDPTLTMGLAFVGFNTWADAGELGEVLRWSQTVIDLAAGDPAKGAGFGFGSPLAIALAWRGNARWWLGRPGWRQDLHDAVAMARNSDAATFAVVVAWIYNLAMDYGVLRADDSAVRVIEEAVQAAGSSHDVALGLAEYTLGIALLSRDASADRHRGLELMVQFREFVRERFPFLVPVAELWVARERAGRGDRNAAIAVMRQAVDELHEAGRLGYGVWGTGVLVETLLDAWRPRATWPKPKRRSTGWRTCGPTKIRRCARSRCCGCARCWPGPAAKTLPIGTWWGAIARWRNRLATKDTSTGPKR